MSELSRVERFVALQSRYQQRIFSFILTLVPHWADAEEVLQETNLILWRKFDSYQPNTDFVRWANQVAYFQVLKFRQRRQKDTVYFSEEFLDEVAQDVFRMNDALADQRNALKNCIEKLSPEERQLVELRYTQQATTKNIASKVGRPIDTIYKSLSRIRHSLLNCVRRTMAALERQ